MRKGKYQIQVRQNPKLKYYQIPNKSQFLNPKNIGSTGIWDLLGSIGIYWDLGFQYWGFPD